MESKLTPSKLLRIPPNNLLFWCGCLLILLGVIHILVWCFDGSSWQGSVSWRKPILFGISTGLTLCSLGWLAANLKSQPWDRVFGWITSVSLVVEVGLITHQQWRGVESHFNRDTPLDGFVDVMMLILICLAFGGIVYFTIRCFGAIRLAPDYKIALRAGMIFLVASCLIGFAISIYGYSRVESGLSPETYGKRGVTKFPHGVVIHAVQMLPAFVWLMRRMLVSSRARQFALWSLTASFALQLLFAINQTLLGFGRFEISTISSIMIAACCMVATVAALSAPVFVARR